MSTEYTFFCAELKETFKTKDTIRARAFNCANKHFKPLFESAGLKFGGWTPDQTKTVMTAKIDYKYLQC